MDTCRILHCWYIQDVRIFLSASSHNLRKWLLSVSLFTCGPVSLRSCDEGGCAELMSAQKRAHQRCSAFHVLKTTDEAPCCACSDFFFSAAAPPPCTSGEWWYRLMTLPRSSSSLIPHSWHGSWHFCLDVFWFFFPHRWNVFYFRGLFLDWWICLWHHVFICVWPDTCSKKNTSKCAQLFTAGKTFRNTCLCGSVFRQDVQLFS